MLIIKIAIINASSQSKTNNLLYQSAKKIESQSNEILNFGSFESDELELSYGEVAILISLLLSSKSVDFVVTGCTSGQGMMLACNALPNIICGYTPTATDAFLFGRINNGNAISIPLGLYSDFTSRIEIENIIESLFKEPLGKGYPREQSDRKISDSNFVKELYKSSQKNIFDVLKIIDPKVLSNVLSKENTIDYIIKNSNEKNVVNEIKKLKNSYLMD